jgi:5-formyltetrahydrofolate cyclo-ligase
MRDQKQNLREQVMLQRETFPADKVTRWNRAIQELVFSLPDYLGARAVALYSPLGNEVDTVGICDHALKSGKKVYYPRVGGESPGLVRVDSRDDLRTRRNGILEPLGDELLTERDPDDLVLFIPGLAFNLVGDRLGRGQGWYDRALGRIGTAPVRVALAFEFQIVESLPVEDWDQKVHQIITEERIICCIKPVSN